MTSNLSNKNNHQSNTLMVKLGFGFLFLLVTASILYALARAFSRPLPSTLFLNPDFNAYTYLARNLIYEHGSIFSWHIGTAPYFIPEIAILYLITLFFKNPYTNLLLYAVFQIIYFLIITPVIFKAATKSIAGFRLGLISVLCFFLVLIIKQHFYMYGNFDYLSAIFAPGFHFGAAILVFTSLFLFLKILSNSKVYLKILLFVLLVLSGMSDPLTYVYFTAPMFATLMVFVYFKKLPKKEFFILAGMLVVAVVTAYTIYHLLPIQYVQLKVQTQFKYIYVFAFIKTVTCFIQKNFVLGILWLSFMIWAPYSLWQSIVRNKQYNQLLDLVILFQFLTVIVSAPLLILAIGQVLPPGFEPVSSNLLFSQPINFYKELGYFPYRYMINFLLGPVFFGLPLLIYKHANGVAFISKNKVYAGILIVYAILLCAIKPHHLYSNNLFHFQSKFSQCLEQDAKIYNLSNGISDNYLASNMLTAFNTKGMHVALVNQNDLTPLRWQNTSQVYKYPNYNFAIYEVTDVDAYQFKNALLEQFGKPYKIASCTDELNNTYAIYIYNSNVMNKVFANYP